MKNFRNTKGFTLIELLIVVVIIGILAAIAIPRFASTKGKAFDAAAKTDLRNAMTAQEAYFSDNQAYTAVLADLDVIPSTGVVLAVTAGDATGYAMNAKHNSSDNSYCVDSDVGEIAPCAVVP
ncbi:MAG TPA: type II secretion system protein [Gemmatimonadota bacterium]|nr:type II secretion system protein [Gemmatimonadota bacterium]